MNAAVCDALELVKDGPVVMVRELLLPVTEVVKPELAELPEAVAVAVCELEPLRLVALQAALFWLPAAI